MNKKVVYTYAKFYLINFIQYYEKKVNDEVLTEAEEAEINKLLVFYKRELSSVKFELDCMEESKNA